MERGWSRPGSRFDELWNFASQLQADKRLPCSIAVDQLQPARIPGELDAPYPISNIQQYCAGKAAFNIVDAYQRYRHFRLITERPVGSTQGRSRGLHASNSAYPYYFPGCRPCSLFGRNVPTLYPPCGVVAASMLATRASSGGWQRLRV